MVNTDPHPHRGNPPLAQCQCHGGCQPGYVNYQNNVLIDNIKRILPNGAEAWYIVAITYKEGLGENVNQDEGDIR